MAKQPLSQLERARRIFAKCKGDEIKDTPTLIAKCEAAGIHRESAIKALYRFRKANGIKVPTGRRKANPVLRAARAGKLVATEPGKAAAAQKDGTPKAPPKITVTRDFCAVAKRYAEAVVAGKVVACKWVRLACQRHLRDLTKQSRKDYPYEFKEQRANEFCTQVEKYPHIKGRWASRREKIHLEDWQCFVLCVPFGWVKKGTGKRRFRKIYWEVPRKNAKSTIAAAIGNNMLTIDGEAGAEVYAGATSEKQAWEVFGPARLMLEKSPEICEDYGIEVWARSIVLPHDASKFQPIIGKPGDGASPSCSIHDEYHEQDTPDQLDTMQTGMGAREQPMLVVITTSGTNLASPCYDEHLNAKKVLEGTIQDEELFAIIYSIDLPDPNGRTEAERKGDDWTDPKVLRKANPNLGVSVDQEFLEAQQRQAVMNPALQNRFKTKHLNIWCAASVAGINMHSWKLATDSGLSLDEFRGEEAVFSLDLASKIDVCSYVKLFTRMVGGQKHYYCFARHFLPEATIEEAKANQQAYRKWVVQGRLVATPGAEIDFDVIKEEVKQDSKKFQALEVVYDPWRATQLAHQLQKEGATVVEMGQTAKNMGEAFDELTSALKGGRFHHDGCPVLEWMASNVVARTAMKGLTVPGKDKPEQKIDGIVATVMAIARMMSRNPSGGMTDWLSNPVVVSA